MKGMLLGVIATCVVLAAVSALRRPVIATYVTDYGIVILAPGSDRCPEVVERLEGGDAAVTTADPWGVEHRIVAASCERGTETIARAALEEAALGQ